MDKKCAAMYVEESINCSYFKSGSTGNARQRKEYRKQFWEKQGLVAPAINFVVNIDSLSTETQTEVSRMILDIAEKYMMYPKRPLTIQGALVCDMNGLSFAVQDFFYDLVVGML
jgi:hypothetical protein